MPQVKTALISIPGMMRVLRDMMAKDMSATRRVNNVLGLLCEQLHMPTIVLYALRPGDVLERLMLAGKNVNLPIFVRVGEGSVGQAAMDRKTRLSPYKNHKTALVVPIIKGNELIGVLQLLSQKKEVLSAEIIEAVENVAMVLAEFLLEATSGKTSKNLGTLSTSKTLEGMGFVQGFAVGEVLLHRRLEVAGPILTTNPDRELKHLTVALNRVQGTLKRRVNRLITPPEEKELCETYLLFLGDEEWKSKINSAILSGLTAQAALHKVGDEMLDKMRSVADPYIRERARDFQDLTAKLMQALVQKREKKKIIGNKILVADTLGAAEFLDYDLKHIKGIILEDGSQTTHVVIVARAYGIPLMGGVKDATRQLDESAPVAMDGKKGKIYLRPSDEILDALKERQKIMLQRERMLVRNIDKVAETKDKTRISLMLNMGLSVGIDKLPPVDGIGLYRTELLFMTSKTLPDIRTQTEAYRRVLMLAKDKPVVFRTLDIGSDKVLPYFEQQGEENPAMGWRSIRMVLDRRALLRNQLRALLRATAGRTLYVMFPMITDIAEFVEAKKTLEIEVKNAQQHHEKTPKEIIVGTMLEVPALIFQLDNLLPLVDFVSIGTNDLAQFMFAADRTNTLIANRYDTLSPAFLKALGYIIQKCHDYHVKCSVCGEMASHSLEALTLIGLGATTLSMSPEALGSIKMAIRSLSLAEFKEYLNSVLISRQPSIREALFSYLRDHHVELGEMI